MHVGFLQCSARVNEWRNGETLCVCVRTLACPHARTQREKILPFHSPLPLTGDSNDDPRTHPPDYAYCILHPFHECRTETWIHLHTAAYP